MCSHYTIVLKTARYGFKEAITVPAAFNRDKAFRSDCHYIRIEKNIGGLIMKGNICNINRSVRRRYMKRILFNWWSWVFWKKKIKIKSNRTIFNLFMLNLKKLPLVSTGITPWEMKTTFFFVDFVGFNIPVSTVVTACQIKSTCNADFEINLISFLFFT